MSTRTASAEEERLVESRDQLIAPMQAGEKPRERWRIGTEHEKLVYSRSDFHAPSYDEPGGIRDMLLAMQEFGWTPVEEGGKVIAMSGADGAISLEPDRRHVGEVVGDQVLAHDRAGHAGRCYVEATFHSR